MALKPEFIGILRDIRDRMYPEIKDARAYVEEGIVAIEVMYANINEIDGRLTQISNEIKSLNVSKVNTIPNNPDGSHGNADVKYSSLTSSFEFDIPVGPKGEKGNTGLQGEKGLKGDKGDQGDIGLQGAQGIQGVEGPKGEQGVQGPVGPKGDQGERGINGLGIDIKGTDTVSNIKVKPATAVGESWIASDSGLDDDGLSVQPSDVMRATGSKWINIGPIKGDKGEKGDIGPTGPQGIQGITGPQGAQGPAGIQGNKGDKGDTGDTGAKGDKGDTGPAGPQGAKGNTGNDGKSYVIKGTKPFIDIISQDMTITEGQLWISSTTGTGAGLIANIGDGIYNDYGSWVNVGPIKGEKGDTPTDTVLQTNPTGEAKIPAGSEAERDPAPQEGYFRFNKTTKQFEGFDGINWGSIGGGATGNNQDQIFYLNDQVVTASYTIPSGKNAHSVGPVTINDNVVVEIPDGSVWAIS